MATSNANLGRGSAPAGLERAIGGVYRGEDVMPAQSQASPSYDEAIDRVEEMERAKTPRPRQVLTYKLYMNDGSIVSIKAFDSVINSQNGDSFYMFMREVEGYNVTIATIPYPRVNFVMVDEFSEVQSANGENTRRVR